MDIPALLAELAYDRSPNFLPATRLGEATEHAHVFRRALRLNEQIPERVGIHGVYLLRDDPTSRVSTSTPIVYVAEAQTAGGADEIHRTVWNQDIVPFLLVRLPGEVRLYSGFIYRRPDEAKDDAQRGLLEPSVPFNQVAARLSELRAQAIDDGSLFRKRSADIDTKSRVDWRLLTNLQKLGQWLHRKGLDPHVAHALIGKFIYLKYLRERDILSNRKLNKWGIQLDRIFGRYATLKDTRRLIRCVDCWLNGSIFPIPFAGDLAPTTEHLREVASVFLGDDYVGDDDENRQLHLNFKAYTFSYIPIETLSVIYEQFLALEGKNQELGAYYTPIPLVNFMLAEIDDLHGLSDQTRILDPSCGSGAFLVQCYRRLIERAIRLKGRALRPAELRDLLVKHVFGVDRDRDACQIAAMSLALTMLDNIEPPDLESMPSFKLPSLHGTNLFEGDFFDPTSTFHRVLGDQRFDWIVGNPPWVEIDTSVPTSYDATSNDRHAAKWMRDRQPTNPVNGNQVAEAFAWKASTHLARNGVAGLLMPAMTLFKREPNKQPGFRSNFFARMTTHVIANFANLRRDLFAQRVEAPAAALFYSCPPESMQARGDVLVYSPLLLNQEANRPDVETGPTKRQHTWTITLSASEIRRVSQRAISSGDSLPFKIAMWGSPRDEWLLRSVGDRFPKLSTYAAGGRQESSPCKMHEGAQLREFYSPQLTEKILGAYEPHSELSGKMTLDVTRLRNCERIYAIPSTAIQQLGKAFIFLRTKGGELGLVVSYPPHIIVHGGRNFATFSDDIIVVPQRHIGIAGGRDERSRLIALSLYLSSDFATYHDFFMSPQPGVRDGRSTLETLGELPFPFADVGEAELGPWVDLYERLALVTPGRWPSTAGTADDEEKLIALTLEADIQRAEIARLEIMLNRMVYDLLGLTETERWLVSDLVHVRRHLSDGQIGAVAIQPPRTVREGNAPSELEMYADVLRHELDAFIDPELGLRHEVKVVHDDRTGMVQADLRPRDNIDCPIEILRADNRMPRELKKTQRRLCDEHPQWLHFDRNLFVYDGLRVLLLKPMQRIHWTRSQALMDADEIIASTLTAEEAG